jgi:hypothetical protein
MADLLTSQQFNVVLTITNLAGQPAAVDGVPVWATSDATVVNILPAADGMSAVAPAVAAGGPARFTVTADADLGAGVQTITGVSEDINVTQDPAQLASVITINLGPAAPKA